MASFGSTLSGGTPALSTSLPRERFPDLIRSGRKSSRSDDADSILPSFCLRRPPMPPAKSFSLRRRRHPLPPAKILCPVMATAQRSVSNSGEIDYPLRLLSPQTNSNELAVTFLVLRARSTDVSVFSSFSS